MLKLRDVLGRAKAHLTNRIVYYFLDSVSGQNPIKFRIVKFIKRKKKIMAFYEDCHNVVYHEILHSSKNLKRQYVILGCKDIVSLAGRYPHYISSPKVWSNVDVFVYTPTIPDRDGIPTLGTILSWISDTCKKVVMTNASFKGYFPQHTPHKPQDGFDFAWGDKNLNNLIANGCVNELDLQKVESKDYYSQEQVIRNWNSALKILELHEEKCDVRISDYVRNYGTSRILYYSATHPKTEVMVEICKRLMRCLSAEEDLTIDEKKVIKLSHHAEAVYPSTAYVLGMDYHQIAGEKFQPGKKAAECFDFHDYVREYIKRGTGD